MGYACGVLLLIAVVGSPLTSVYISEPGIWGLGVGAIAVSVLPLVLYLHENKCLYLRDSFLAILWVLFFTIMLGFPVTVAARIGASIPLRDPLLEHWDRLLGVYVPAVEMWASRHWLGNIVNASYPLLFSLMKIAVLLPILAGKLRCTQRFVIANLLALLIGLPIFAAFPAVGPWYISHLPSRIDQSMAETMVLLVRQPGPYLYQYPAGVICFPSFHVIWAMLSVQALWGIRILRIPATIFAAVIIVSTITTGNHYVVDVLAGIAVAVVAMFAAQRISRSFVEHPAPSFRFMCRLIGGGKTASV